MRLIRLTLRGGVMVCLAAGIMIVLVQSFWITYGVFVRYVLGDPDATVTEATALLLVPLAFLGLPYALRQDAFPQVTYLRDKLPPPLAAALSRINLLMMIFVGFYFAAVTINATQSSFLSGASSSVLGWPEYLFWAPVALAAIVFLADAVLKLFSPLEPPDTGE